VTHTLGEQGKKVMPWQKNKVKISIMFLEEEFGNTTMPELFLQAKYERTCLKLRSQ